MNGSFPALLSSTNDYGYTPMHIAVYHSDTEVMEWLKGQSLDLNASDHESKTPMHEAVRWSNVEMIRWLKEQGTDMNAKDSNDETPLSLAMRLKRTQDSSSRHRYLAIAPNRTEVVDWLRANGATE